MIVAVAVVVVVVAVAVVVAVVVMVYAVVELAAGLLQAQAEALVPSSCISGNNNSCSSK